MRIAPEIKWPGTVEGRSLGYKCNTRYGKVSCPDCKQERWVQYIHGEPTRHYCQKCASIKAANSQRKGPKSSKWKGGRFLHSNGYVLVKDERHHRANVSGYVYEHIKIWEQVHNRHVPQGCVIHHLNGIKTDNRPDNLVAMKRGAHVGLAIPYKKRIRELEVRIDILQDALKNNQLMFNIGEN